VNEPDGELSKGRISQAQGANKSGAKKPRDESARGQTSQGVNKPGNEPAKGRKSHNSNNSSTAELILVAQLAALQIAEPLLVSSDCLAN